MFLVPYITVPVSSSTHSLFSKGVNFTGVADEEAAAFQVSTAAWSGHKMSIWSDCFFSSVVSDRNQEVNVSISSVGVLSRSSVHVYGAVCDWVHLSYPIFSGVIVPAWIVFNK